MMRPLRLCCCSMVVCLVAAGWAHAEAEGETPFSDEAGPEMWIDGPLAVQVGGTKTTSDVAVDDLGRRIHVWAASSGGTDVREIYLRRWDATAAPLEDPKMVNTTKDDLQDSPRVAVAADGSFLVIWDSRESGLVVRSQAYNATGDPVGTEQLVSPSDINCGSCLTEADVAALRTPDGSPGGYIVVWNSLASVGTDTNSSIQGCLIGNNGVAGASFQINSQDAPQQRYSSVTELNDGGFFVVWSDVSNGEVWGRRFNSAGGPIGNDFQISTEYDTGTFETDVAIGRQGSIAVVWRDRDEPLPSTDELEIRARLFDANLVPLGADFRVNNLLDQDQVHPRVSDFGPAGFLVVWQSESTSGDDPVNSVEARLVTGPGQFADPQVQYNISINGTQSIPGAHGWYGRQATNWISGTLDGEPANNAGFVIGRDIDHCVFCDDLDWHESGGNGNLWRWSVTVGEEP